MLATLFQICHHTPFDYYLRTIKRYCRASSFRSIRRTAVRSLGDRPPMIVLQLLLHRLEVVDGQTAETPEPRQLLGHIHLAVTTHTFPRCLAILVLFPFLPRGGSRKRWLSSSISDWNQAVVQWNVRVIEVCTFLPPKYLWQRVARRPAVSMLSCSWRAWPRGYWNKSIWIQCRRIGIFAR
jgi:hypothetical protein